MADERIRAAGALRESFRAPGLSLSKVLKRYVNFASFVVILILIATFLPSAKTNKLVTANTSGITPAPAPGTAGVMANGTMCGPGVPQVTWSKYSPLCEPAWNPAKDQNGGATSNGVTATTINLTYREATTSELQLLYGLVHESVIGTNAAAETTMAAYIKFFNSQFDLYGRKVVLVPFTGQGNFISEDTGGGLTEAKADAVTAAHTLNAFADMSLVDASNAYAQDLENQGVISFSIYENPQSYYVQNAPYAYSPGPNCSENAMADAAIVAKSVDGLPAIYAGDPSMHSMPGKVGILYQDTPTATQCAQEMANDITNVFGAPAPAMQSYAFDLSTFSQESAAMIASMKQKNVTTVICAGCDPVSPAFLFQAADQQNYYPEWIYSGLFSEGFTGADGFGTLYPQDQMIHDIGIGEPMPSNQLQQEAYQVYLKTKAPLSQLLPSYTFAYVSLLQFFDALQAAGPDLTPATFQQGMFNTRGDLPDSAAGGNYGGWHFGPNRFDPAASIGIVYWDPNAKSNLSGTEFYGKKGAFVACNGGAQYSFTDDFAALPNHKQLACFGKS